MQTVKIHRGIKASPEKIFRAFMDPIAYATWIPPFGFLCVIDKMEPKLNGEFRMSFVNFSTGNRHSFGGRIVEMKENEFIKYSERFDDPNLPGEMITSVWLQKTSVGTEISITQENIPAAIPTEMCYLGWQDSMDKLIRLVEPEIPDV